MTYLFQIESISELEEKWPKMPPEYKAVWVTVIGGIIITLLPIVSVGVLLGIAAQRAGWVGVIGVMCLLTVVLLPFV